MSPIPPARRPGAGPTPVLGRRIEVRPFGALDDGRPVDLYLLTAPSGMSAQITNYGGIVTALRAPDRNGRLDDVVLGYDRLEDYLRDPFYFGALIGRYANRIGDGRFSLGAQRVSVERNEEPNHLHGGSQGFHKMLWTARPFERDRAACLELRHRSPDGHGGYPGNLQVTVVYALTDGGELVVEYIAESDRDTIVNLTHHGYFNLSGDLTRDVLDHELVLRAGQFTPVDDRLIPTGELRGVAGTPFDFTQPAPIGARIDHDEEQLALAHGYDHNWVLDVRRSPSGSGGDTDLPRTDPPAPVARALCPATGRMLEVSTTEPGIQFYAGNWLAPDIVGKSGLRYGRRSAFCLETQHFPDSPNKPHFPSVTLRAGERYRSTTVFRFATVAASAPLSARW